MPSGRARSAAPPQPSPHGKGMIWSRWLGCHSSYMTLEISGCHVRARSSDRITLARGGGSTCRWLLMPSGRVGSAAPPQPSPHGKGVIRSRRIGCHSSYMTLEISGCHVRARSSDRITLARGGGSTCRWPLMPSGRVGSAAPPLPSPHGKGVIRSRRIGCHSSYMTLEISGCHVRARSSDRITLARGGGSTCRWPLVPSGRVGSAAPPQPSPHGKGMIRSQYIGCRACCVTLEISGCHVRARNSDRLTLARGGGSLSDRITLARGGGSRNSTLRIH